MRKTFSLFLMAFILSLLGTTAQAKVIYVKLGSTGDGSTWYSAYGNLQDAIDAAQLGDEIWIAEGTYKPERLIKTNKKNSRAFILKDGVSLYGGFLGSEMYKEQRVKAEPDENIFISELYQYQTILDADDDVADEWIREIEEGSTYRYSWRTSNDDVIGTANNSNHVLYCADEIVNTIEINGLTLKGANAKEWKAKAAGGALYAKGNVKLTGCRIMENQAWFKVESMTNSDTMGGAVYLDGGSEAEISNCYFTKNYSHSSYGSGFGGAIYAKNVKIKGCLFDNCVGLDGGGAIYNIGGSIEFCTFNDCYSSAGGAVYNNDGVFEHSSIFGCRGLIGGALANKGTARYLIIANCYADAEEFGADSGKGGGVWNEYGDLSNCLIYNNKASRAGGVAIKSGRVINCTVQHNALRDAASNANIEDLSGNEDIKVFNTIGAEGDANDANFIKATSFVGNAINDVQLKDIYSADWRLAPGSEFIDAGEMVYGFTQFIDLAGNDRVMGNAIDMGAFESSDTKEAVPAVVITFEEPDIYFKIGVGGDTGNVFAIDWGDGVKEEHDAAAYYKGKLTGNVMKIYGDDIQVLYAQNLGITDIDISNATNMGKMLLGNNKLTRLDVSNNPKLHGLYCENNMIEALDVANNSNIKVIDCSGNKIQGTIDCSAMPYLSKIDCSYNEVSELLLPHHSTVYEVSCGHNKISELDLSGLTGLDQLNCFENNISSISVDDLTSATEMSLYGNNLTSIDVSGCVNVQTLSVAENKLESIDLSNNTAIEGLYLFNNNLKSLDITQNTNIRWMNIEYNQIEGTFDISAQTMLSLFIANNNQIDNISFENNKNCLQIQLADNNLTNIDVSMLGSLSWLKVDGNNISALDLSKNGYLYWLECGRNHLNVLDITKNTYLQRLEADSNGLSTIAIPEGNGLEGVKIADNGLDVDKINDIIYKLKDVNNVQINENNKDWGRILDISRMLGTADADVAAAIEKGWTVIADVPTSIDNAETNGNIERIVYYTADGKVIDRIAVPGLYVVKYIYNGGKTKSEKILVK